MPRGERRKPESPPMEEECDYKTRTKKRTRKKFLRHGILSRKAKQFQKMRICPENLDTNYYAENYGNTEEEDHHHSDTSVLLQHGLNQHKESSESDLEDNFWNCRENPSDRRKV
jgi:hypothetical protein